MSTFNPSTPLTLGLELELQIVDPATGRLSPSSMAVWEALRSTPSGDRYALEATLSTIELNTGVHDNLAAMEQEALELTRAARAAAQGVGADLRGGGTQVSQFWNERRIAPSVRARELEQRFGFLPKRFSTYGMHVHVGMPDGDTAVRVANVLQALTPLFIALSAASPFLQLADTGYAAARPLESLVYPQGGPMPFVRDWNELTAAAQEIYATGIGHSLKDIYWDVRPKPEFGTVEVRVFDTPLCVSKAVALAAFTRALAALALDGTLALAQPPNPTMARMSRFLACRDAMEARLMDPFGGEAAPAHAQFEQLLQRIDERGVLPADASARRRLSRLLARGEDHRLMRRAWGQLADEHHHADEGHGEPHELQDMLVRYSALMCDHLLDTSVR